MTRTTTQNFRNADGSINTARAMRAGHEARSQAFREIFLIAVKMISARQTPTLKKRNGHVVVTGRKSYRYG